MSGRTVVEETMAGAGEVADAAHELHELEHAMADPERGRRARGLIERFGDAQARFEELDGYALEARAREILAGLGFAGVRGRRRGEALGRLEDARGPRPHPAHAPRRAAPRRAHQPPRHRVHPLARALPQGLRGRPGDDLPRPRVHEPPGQQDRRDRRRRAHHLTRATTTSTSSSASCSRAQQEAQLRPAAGDARQGEAFIERFKARASHAAQVQSRVKKLDKIERVEPPKRRKVIEFDFRQPPRSGEDVAKLEGRRKAYGQAHDLRRLRPAHPPPRALVRDGRERRGQVHAAQAGRRRGRSPTRARSASARA
jgi:hypothetical protein